MWTILASFIEVHPYIFWSTFAVVVYILTYAYGKLEDLRDEWAEKRHNHNPN